MGLDKLNTDNLLAIAAILGAIIAPLMSGYGLLLQHRRDKPKVEAETKRLKLEAQAIDQKVDVDVVSSYSSIVADLRNQVDSLIEISKKNSGEIAMLKAQLNTAVSDKLKLERDNAELTREVAELRKEVEVLRSQLQERSDNV
jgi:predicted RNase H-like nuclease (RuvC/YqgF family)